MGNGKRRALEVKQKEKERVVVPYPHLDSHGQKEARAQNICSTNNCTATTAIWKMSGSEQGEKKK